MPDDFERNVQAEQQVIDANDRFGFDLYAYLSKNPDFTGKNLFFSPCSISSAFAITYEGARTRTADEIRNVFHLPADDLIRRQGFVGMGADLNQGNTLRTTNVLWAQKNYQFLPEYTRIAKKYYAAETKNLDFFQDPEGSRATINALTENQTEGQIRELLPKGSIDSSTALVITNTVYFKGSWEMAFNKDETENSTFTVSRDQIVDAHLMHRDDNETMYQYGKIGELQILELPYSNSSSKKMSMLVLLPGSYNISQAESLLTERGLDQIRSSLGPHKVNIYLPKFSIDTSYKLPKILSAMGMPIAFTKDADLSGMDGTDFLFIANAFHKAHVEVNEEGTEAAAASSCGIMTFGGVQRSPDSPVLFRADRPFVFLIQDDETGNILFIGRVVEPAEWG